jgi:16S rRNA (guanine966-N2)-methyltransferase
MSRVINTNSISFDYKTLKQKFDIIFLDPPFHENLIPKSLEVICNQNILNEGGLIYVECEKDLKLDLSKFNLNELKESRGGETKYYLYEG